ncbi:MAG: methyltransferase domain-containing protein [Chloroflexi bacterium]|nr:methyltransferase domain-containing protein [Chloroflexota bacterium]
MARETIGLDKFKERTLRRLKVRNEEQRSYPIAKSDLISHESCIICSSKSIVRLTELYYRAELNFFSTSVCQRCLYVFRSISPSYLWFKKCWAMIATKKLEVFNPEIEKIRQDRYEKYYQFLSKYAKNSVVLDVGSGYGSGSKSFQDHGCKVEALEVEDDKAHYVKECLSIPLHAASIEEFALRKKDFGLVLFAHCLEHLDNPAFVMSKISNLLDPKMGILYLEVPILWESVNWSDALYLTHKSNFTEENLSYLVIKNGFEILEKVRFRHTENDPWDLGFVLKPTGNPLPRISNLGVKKDGCDIDDIRKLYRKNMPITPPPLEEVIRYNINVIEHFYQTLRLDSKKIAGPTSGSGFVTFE